MFLADFSISNEDKKKKNGMLGTVKNVVIGKTLPGTLTRVGSLGTIGAGLYGLKKMNNNSGIISPLQKEFYRKQNLANTIKKGIKTTGAGGALAGSYFTGKAIQNEYDKRNRKWWEIL